MDHNLDIVYWESPIGILELSASVFGLRFLKCVDQSVDSESTNNIHLKNAITQLDEYFSGNRETFALIFDLEGSSEFEQKVWNEIQNIPFGTTMTYSDIASKIGNPKAARAVGKANGVNPIAIIIPCHRLLGKDGKLRGYAYGIDRKSALIKHENHFLLKKREQI